MGVFGVWCGKCAKYLAFGTFTTPAVDALTALKQITQERNLLSRTNRAASLHLQQKLEMEVLPLSKAEKIYSY